jgi:hypothetical protein
VAEGPPHRRSELCAYDFEADVEAGDTEMELGDFGWRGLARALKRRFQQAEGNLIHRY